MALATADAISLSVHPPWKLSLFVAYPGIIVDRTGTTTVGAWDPHNCILKFRNHCHNLLDAAGWMVSPRQRIWVATLKFFRHNIT